MSAEDEIARMRAEGDQARAGSGEFAGTLGAFYTSLTSAGMFPEHALQITLHWMTLMAGPGLEGDDE